VLAILLLNANKVVSCDRLINELWGERPPESAAKALQGYVSALRKALDPERERGGASEILVTRPPGYAIELEPEQLDLIRFERLHGEARNALAAADPSRAGATLREALALWRGPPLADLAYASFAQAEIDRLEGLRLGALEERIETDLALGRLTDVVGELEELTARYPLRERLRGQLMLALYRSGRQAEALEAYRHVRRTLVEELGIEPGRELRELEQAIFKAGRLARSAGRGRARGRANARAAARRLRRPCVGAG
jgi:DNA-binding SARP family transcriptional activator